MGRAYQARGKSSDKCPKFLSPVGKKRPGVTCLMAELIRAWPHGWKSLAGFIRLLLRATDFRILTGHMSFLTSRGDRTRGKKTQSPKIAAIGKSKDCLTPQHTSRGTIFQIRQRASGIISDNLRLSWHKCFSGGRMQKSWVLESVA